MTAPSRYRRISGQRLDAALADLPNGHTLRQAEKALMDPNLYPFAERMGFAYKCFLDERRKRLEYVRKLFGTTTTPGKPPDAETGIRLTILANGRPWLSVSCRWCDGKVKGGCMVCVGHHKALAAAVAYPECAALRLAARKDVAARLALADWYRENVGGLIE